MARDERRRPLPTTGIGAFLEGLAPWRNTLIVTTVAACLVGAAQVAALVPWVAMALAVGGSVVIVAIAGSRVLDGSPALRVATLCVVAAAAVLIGRDLWFVFLPPAPLSEAVLTAATPDADLAVPDPDETFDVEIRGRLLGEQGSAKGRYRVHLSRGAAERSLSGELVRRVRAGRLGRRGPAVESLSVHEQARHPLVLAGAGPIHAHLLSATGLEDGIAVSVARAPLAGTALWGVLGGLALAALILEAWAGWEGIAAPLTAALSSAGLLTAHLMHRYDPGDPLGTVFGGLVFAALAGGLGGFVIGAGVASIARKRALRKERASSGR